MGVRNYLIDGGSGTGKTTVCEELRRRGYQAIDGDTELRVGVGTHQRRDLGTDPRYDAETTAAASVPGPDDHLPPVWDVAKVKALLADHAEAVTFFCGGRRPSPGPPPPTYPS